MKKILIFFSVIVIAILTVTFAHATTCYLPQIGGTGTCTAPTKGQVLVGQTNGTYNPQATSTLGITGFDSSGLIVNVPVTWDGSKLTATGTPELTVGYITATSTNATSTFSSGLQAGVGSLANPSFSFIGDPSTGIFDTSASHILNFTNNGTLKAQITSTELLLASLNIDNSVFATSYFLKGTGGLVGSPTYSFNGDQNTGMWSSAADTLDFTTGGTDRMLINSSGNVGIATTSPGSLLSVGNTNGINITSATSTFGGTGGGLNIKSGCYAINGNCISGSGGGSPGGSDTQIQYNNSGAFGADANFKWNKDGSYLTIASSTKSNSPMSLLSDSSGTFNIFTLTPFPNIYSTTGNGFPEFQFISNTSGLSSTTEFFMSGDNSSSYLDEFAGNHDAFINLSDDRSQTIQLETGGDSWIDNKYNFGIGTTSPYTKLAVTGRIAANSIYATSTTETNYFANSVGIGTTSPSEILHLFKPSGQFTTMRFDSGSTKGYMYAYDGTPEVSIGSDSNAPLNFKVNNATEAFIPTGQGGFTDQSSTGSHSWLNVTAPSASPNEATLTTKLDHGSGNTEFTDWTTENYGTDWQHSINVAKAGTGSLLPFSLRFWNSDLGNIAANGVYSQTWLPKGTIGFGVSTSTAGTSGANTLLYAASSTATSILKLDGAPGTNLVTVLGSGNVGIGTSNPSEILHISKPTGNFTTIRYDSGTTQGYFYAYDGDNSINVGANSNSQLNFKVNNSTKALIDTSGNFAIGTSTPYALLSIQSNSSTGDAFAVATSSTHAIAGYDNDGHRFTSGPAPAVSSCGTGTGTVVGDDQSGTVTTATAATACTLTFSKAYRKTPTCTVTDNSLVGFADISSISTSAVTFGISSALSGGNLYYSCVYHQ